MKGYCKNCGKEIDETEQIDGICKDCWLKSHTVEWDYKHDGIITRRRKL